MNVANRINSLLAERGIDKGTFYKAVGISSASFSQWRTGISNPTQKRLEQIAEYFDMSVSELLSEEEKPAPISEDGLTDLQRALINAVPQMSDKTILLLMQIKDAIEDSRNLPGD